MKKLMTALTICAVAGFAVAADVVSENIVGFATVSVTTGNFGIQPFGVQFSNMSELTGKYVVDGSFFGVPLANGDQIMFFDGPGSYNFEAAIYDSGTTSWSYYDGYGNPVTKPLNWKPELLPGDSVTFISANGSGDYKMVGEVNGGTQVFGANDIKGISSLLPVDTKGADLGSFMLAGDQVMVFDPILYNFAAYIYDGSSLFNYYDAAGNAGPDVPGTAVILPIGTGGIFIGNGSGSNRSWVQTL